MSRLSRVPRESIFSGGSQAYKADDHATCSPSLLDCVSIFEDVCAETYEAQQLLRSGTHDLKRMSHVLENQRVFLFVNESTVRKYKADLTEEIEPQILELIERAKKGMRALEKKHHSLQAKAEHAPVAKATAHRSAAGKIEARRLQLLKSQRQSLESELQILQKEMDALEGYDVSS